MGRRLREDPGAFGLRGAGVDQHGVRVLDRTARQHGRSPPLPFPSIVVASRNDEYVSVDRARSFAASWGSRIVFIGDAGHINGAAGYGPWPEGERMFLDFCSECA